MIASFIDSETKLRLFECADGRNSAKDPSWTRRKTDIFNDQEVDRLGIIGEYAAADVFGVDIDWNITVHGDKGHDLILPNKWTAAVKFNHRYEGYLMIEGRDTDTDDELSDLTTDVLILTHTFCEPKQNICHCHKKLLNPLIPSTVIIAGWISRQEFMKVKGEANWGAGVRHFVEVSDLHHPCELMALSRLHVPAARIGGRKPVAKRVPRHAMRGALELIHKNNGGPCR